jgi:hypothetical protein
VAEIHPESMSVRHVVPPAFVAYLVMTAVVGVRRPAWLVTMLAPYAVALTVASLHTARRLESAAERARVPAAFLAMHVGWGVGFWAGAGSRLRDRVSRR